MSTPDVPASNSLHAFAQASTPQNVQVPNTPAGLYVWALGQYGPTVAYLAVTLIALNMVFAELMKSNERMMAINERMIQALVAQSESNNRVVAAMMAQNDSNNRVATAMDNVTSELREIRRAPRSNTP